MSCEVAHVLVRIVAHVLVSYKPTACSREFQSSAVSLRGAIMITLFQLRGKCIQIKSPQFEFTAKIILYAHVQLCPLTFFNFVRKHS